MTNDESNEPGGEQPQAPAAAAAAAPAAAPAKKKSGTIAILALVFGAVAVIFALIPFVVFVAPLFGLAALILAIIALTKKSGHIAVRVLSLILAVIAAPLAIIGLVGTFLVVPPSLDGRAVASEIETKILENYAMSATVECDDTLSGFTGDTFECSVIAQSGNVGSVLVTLEDGGEWSVNIEDPGFFTILSRDEVEATIENEIFNEYSEYVDVICPENMFGGIDTKLYCEATDGTNTGEIELTITGGSSDDWVWELIG